MLIKWENATKSDKLFRSLFLIWLALVLSCLGLMVFGMALNVTIWITVGGLTLVVLLLVAVFYIALTILME